MGLTVLDAGVIIALLDDRDTHHQGARTALTAARDAGDRLVVPASAYAETLVAPFRQGAAMAEVVDEFLDAVDRAARCKHGGRDRPGVARLVGWCSTLSVGRQREMRGRPESGRCSRRDTRSRPASARAGSGARLLR